MGKHHQLPFIICCSLLIGWHGFVYGQTPITKDTSLVDFFKIPIECLSDEYYGRLQGTKHANDSTGYLGRVDVYCKISYEIIFLYKDINTRLALGDDALSKIFFDKQLGKDIYSDFTCYTFIYPQRNPETQDDIHDMNIDFPVNVTAYKRVGKNTWKYLSKIRAKTHHELCEFKFNTIYEINKK
jgi:hypothetical protein